MEKISESRDIPAAPGEIFDVLSNPERHAETDSTGGVRSVDQGQRLTKVGDRFRMNMVKPDGEEYQTMNEVFAFSDDRVIGWVNECNVTSGVEVGAKWLYELEPIDADNTKVTLTYDPSEIEDPAVQSVAKNFDAKVLENSLADLAAAVS